MWLFDGSKLAWAPTLVDRGEVRVHVDLNEGREQPSRQDSNFYVTLRKTTQIQVSILQGYLDRRVQFTSQVQETMNFLDHLIRQWPSENLLPIKRNFYKIGERGQPLQDDNLVEVHKGTYVSARISHNLSQGGIGLGLNADVANTCFWVGRQTILDITPKFLATLDRRWNNLAPGRLADELKPVRGSNGKWTSSDAFKQLRKLRKLKFKVRCANRRNDDKMYTIMDFEFNPNYGAVGGTARTVTFDLDGRQISVFDYYQEKYRVTLRWANLPVISTGKGEHIPMELAWLEPMQRYLFKLNPEQTSAMIKVAVTRPKERRAAIQRNVADLQLANDPYLRFFGAQFDSQFAKTEAKVLPPPAVNFAAGPPADPKFSGRWDLRGKKFWKSNRAPLNAWGFMCMENCVTKPALQQFAATFRQTFLGHGGQCPNEAILIDLPSSFTRDAAGAVNFAFEQIGRQRGYPQLLFIVVSAKNSQYYERLKKNADCRFGILSQVVNSAAVRNNNGQYHSNVCMKVNAKLGGGTSRTAPPWPIPAKSTYFPQSRPTVIIGVDVSHGAPGTPAASTAAMTMSVDPDATRYAAVVETNGYRVEMLTASNVHFMIGQLIAHWRTGHVGAFPTHVIYFRDGVSEGQFAQVLDQEISEIKRWFRQNAGKMPMPKFTVIVATKRHHIRFFPQKGDKNGNPLPGTLVEKEVTHPFLWDFYMCSHVAIQGTARPVHYHIIMDEVGVPVNDIQKMIYYQCYSYARSTTPVSLHPAIYYAHLASNRARAHENIATSDGSRAGAKGHEVVRDQVAKGALTTEPHGTDAPPLLALGGKPSGQPAEGEMRQRDFFRGTMWYI